jgi:TfoX/Sxy family transcriptional regulator of competence genes
LPYWEAPSELFDDADAMIDWAKAAFAVALRARKPEAPPRSKKKQPKKPHRKITKI